jgi:hypothetical protein
MSDVGQLIERVRQLEAALPPENVQVPYLSGDARVGGELTCTMGEWNCMSGGTYAYAFSGGGVATDNRYVPAAGDADTDVTCIVTATNPNGALAAPPSNPVHIAAAGDVVRSTILTAGGTAPRPGVMPPPAAPTPPAPTPPPAAHREAAHDDARRDRK